MRNKINGGLSFKPLKHGMVIYSPPYRILVYSPKDDANYGVAVYKSGSNTPIMFIRRTDDVEGTFEALDFIYKRDGNKRKSTRERSR